MESPQSGKDVDKYIELIRTCLLARLTSSAMGATGLSETHQPPHDPNDDYRVIYEARVEPAALDQLRLELWVTDGGAVGVGLENRGRVARLFGARTSAPSVFVAGHEPTYVSFDYLRQLVSVVAAGAVSARATILLGRLAQVRLVPGRVTSDSIPDVRIAFRAVAPGLRLPLGRRAQAAYRAW